MLLAGNAPLMRFRGRGVPKKVTEIEEEIVRTGDEVETTFSFR